MSSSDSIWALPSDMEYSRRRSQTTSSSQQTDQNKCEWVLSVDGKYLIGYISIVNPSSEMSHYFLPPSPSLGATLIEGGQYGAIVDHVTPGTSANTACKLKVGDEIVEWNGHSFKNKKQADIDKIIDDSRGPRTRIVAVRSNNNLIDFSTVPSVSNVPDPLSIT